MTDNIESKRKSKPIETMSQLRSTTGQVLAGIGLVGSGIAIGFGANNELEGAREPVISREVVMPEDLNTIGCATSVVKHGDTMKSAIEENIKTLHDSHNFPNAENSAVQSELRDSEKRLVPSVRNAELGEAVITCASYYWDPILEKDRDFITSAVDEGNAS